MLKCDINQFHYEVAKNTTGFRSSLSVKKALPASHLSGIRIEVNSY